MNDLKFLLFEIVDDQSRHALEVDPPLFVAGYPLDIIPEDTVYVVYRGAEGLYLISVIPVQSVARGNPYLVEFVLVNGIDAVMGKTLGGLQMVKDQALGTDAQRDQTDKIQKQQSPFHA